MVALSHQLSEKRKIDLARRSQFLPSIGEAARLEEPVRRTSSLLVREEQSLRMNAKKEAYETLRSGLTPDENQNLMATAQAIMRSRGVIEQAQSTGPTLKLGPLRSSQVSSLRASYSSPSISLSPTRASLSMPVSTPMTGSSSRGSSRPTSRPAQMTRSSLYFAPIN